MSFVDGSVRRFMYRRYPIAIIFVAALVFAGCAVNKRPSGQLRLQMQESGDAVRQSIEEFQIENGKLPVDLEDLPIAVSEAEQFNYGPWKYALVEGGYILSIGDYEEFGFLLFWDSRQGHWYMDT